MIIHIILFDDNKYYHIIIESKFLQYPIFI